MTNQFFNISQIEDYLSNVFSDVSKNIYFGCVPELLTCEDFVLIDIPNGIQDLTSYSKGVVLVYLYAMPLAEKCKNVNQLLKMEQALNTALEQKQYLSNIYNLTRRNAYSDYDPQLQWHCDIVELNLTIY